jgi:hypothetical protein
LVWYLVGGGVLLLLFLRWCSTKRLDFPAKKRLGSCFDFLILTCSSLLLFLHLKFFIF